MSILKDQALAISKIPGERNPLAHVLPTPPLPLKTNTRCLTPASLCEMTSISGSGPLGAAAHICWFGHPAHESAAPAFSDSGPGQASGSGATSAGFAFIGFARTSCTDSGSSNDGAMVVSCARSEGGWNADCAEAAWLRRLCEEKNLQSWGCWRERLIANAIDTRDRPRERQGSRL